MKMVKKNEESKQEINVETYLKKTKIKRENMGKTDTKRPTMSDENKKQRLKQYQKKLS